MGKNYTYSRFGSIAPNRLINILTITFLITLTAFYPASAQQEVFEIERYLSNKVNTQKALELESLVYDVHPTIYFNNGSLAPKGNGPMTVANINAENLGMLQEGHLSTQTVRLLLISFPDLQELQAFRLEPAQIAAMPNLAYVFLSLAFDEAPAEIFSGIQGFEGSEIVFLYESARPF